MDKNCKGCQKIISDDQFKEVGNWVFCLECFQKLLQKSKDRTEQNVEPKVEGLPLAMSTSLDVKVEDKPHCHVCNRELIGSYKTLGEWKLCSACYTELMPPSVPEVKKMSRLQDETPLSDEPSRQMVQTSQVPEINQVVIHVERVCKGCGRKVVEGGYKMLDQDAFCPDCYYALLDIINESQRHSNKRFPPGRVEARPLSTMPEIASRQTSSRQENLEMTTSSVCQSCLHPLPHEALKLVEGFFICMACLSTDPDSAIQIARTRHRKRLQQIREELKDDSR